MNGNTDNIGEVVAVMTDHSESHLIGEGVVSLPDNEDECEHGNPPGECRPCFLDEYPTQADYDSRNDPRI